MASGTRAPCGVGHLAPARGDGFLDRQQRLREVGPAGVVFQPFVIDYVVGFQHQPHFHLGRVVEDSHAGEELHQLSNAGAHAGRIHADVGHPIALGDLLDERRLVFELHALELVAFQHAELAPRHQRRGHNHDARAVAGLSRVVADPHGAVAVGPDGKRLVIDLAGLQHREREHTGAVVHELAHQQVGELLGAVVTAQLLDIEQVTATVRRVQHGHDLAPDGVLAGPATHQARMAHVQHRGQPWRQAGCGRAQSPTTTGRYDHDLPVVKPPRKR